VGVALSADIASASERQTAAAPARATLRSISRARVVRLTPAV